MATADHTDAPCCNPGAGLGPGVRKEDSTALPVNMTTVWNMAIPAPPPTHPHAHLAVYTKPAQVHKRGLTKQFRPRPSGSKQKTEVRYFETLKTLKANVTK
jgi:hypothetical protein